MGAYLSEASERASKAPAGSATSLVQPRSRARAPRNTSARGPRRRREAELWPPLALAGHTRARRLSRAPPARCRHSLRQLEEVAAHEAQRRVVRHRAATCAALVPRLCRTGTCAARRPRAPAHTRQRRTTPLRRALHSVDTATQTVRCRCARPALLPLRAPAPEGSCRLRAWPQAARRAARGPCAAAPCPPAALASLRGSALLAGVRRARTSAALARRRQRAARRRATRPHERRPRTKKEARALLAARRRLRRRKEAASAVACCAQAAAEAARAGACLAKKEAGCRCSGGSAKAAAAALLLLLLRSPEQVLAAARAASVPRGGGRGRGGQCGPTALAPWHARRRAARARGWAAALARSAAREGAAEGRGHGGHRRAGKQALGWLTGVGAPRARARSSALEQHRRAVPPSSTAEQA